MPNSYQINFYDRHIEPNQHFTHVDRKASREKENLCEECVVFANFNKQDKIEPIIFDLWLDVLKAVPNSVLWLLKPSHRFVSSGIEENLRLEAAARGVKPTRLVFAERVSKQEHLKRVGLADLFLDSFLYGGE